MRWPAPRTLNLRPGAWYLEAIAARWTPIPEPDKKHATCGTRPGARR